LDHSQERSAQSSNSAEAWLNLIPAGMRYISRINAHVSFLINLLIYYYSK
jgi:hypothetical protein